MPVSIPQIVAAAPLTVQPSETKTFDTWFLEGFKLQATPNRTFNAKVSWRLGRTKEDGSSEMSDQKGFCLLEDLLSENCLTENPEVAAVLPSFLGALEAVSRRKNAIR
jgi:hypothetical protein